MKKWSCLFLIVVLCCSMVLPALAEDGLFVPSIDYKPSPEVEKAVMGDEDVKGCLVVTSIVQAEEKSTDIYQEERDLLLDVYGQLSENSMTLPIEKDYVIRELVDVSFKVETCREPQHGHKEKLAEEGVTLTVDFDLGVKQGTEVIVMTYINGVWEPIESVTNNQDGTVTCVFEDICPVAFCVVKDGTDPSPTGDLNAQQLMLWFALMTLSMAAIVGMMYARRKNHA